MYCSYVYFRHTFLSNKFIDEKDCCLFTGESFNTIESKHIIVEFYGKKGIRFWHEDFFLDERLKCHPYTRQILNRQELLYFKNNQIIRLFKISYIILILNYSCSCLFIFSTVFFEYSSHDILQFLTLALSYCIVNFKHKRKNVKFLIYVFSSIFKLNYICKLNFLYILRIINCFLFFYFTKLLNMEYKNIICFTFKYLCTILETYKRFYFYVEQQKNDRKKKNTTTTFKF